MYSREVSQSSLQHVLLNSKVVGRSTLLGQVDDSGGGGEACAALSGSPSAVVESNALAMVRRGLAHWLAGVLADGLLGLPPLQVVPQRVLDLDKRNTDTLIFMRAFGFKL